MVKKPLFLLAENIPAGGSRRFRARDGAQMRRDLKRLLRPRSIAVIGGGAWCTNVVEQCRKMGFDGAIWPVHPTRHTLAGVPAFAGIADVPGVPDAAFIGVNRHATVEIVRHLAGIGAGGAVCFASGFREAQAETGDGAGLQEALLQAAGEMPILGPNCYGVINYLDGALLWPDQHGGRRVEAGAALLSQSSNIAINLTMQARGLPLAYIACLGNAAQVGLAGLAQALLDDPRVTALGLYIEGVGDAPAFAAMAHRARAAGKPIVALKSGKTEGARAAAASHTAALAGEGAASGAFLRQCGVAEVAGLDELIETLKIVHVHGGLPGARLCSVSSSGGEAGLMADLAVRHGLRFEPPAPEPAARLSEVLGPLVRVANPLDYHTFIWGDLARTTFVFATMLGDYDAGLFVIDPPRPDRCDPASFEPALEAVEAAQAVTGKPAFPVASLPENFDEPRAIAMMGRGVVPLMGLDTALGAIKAACLPQARPGWCPWPVGGAGEVRLLDEAAAKARLAAAGIMVPRGITAPTLAALDPSGARLSPPFAHKGLGLAHKTEVGAVRLDVADPGHEADMPGVTGYLLEEMVTEGMAEMLLGLRRDPVYGATLTLGLGGVAAELMADTVTLVCPATADDIAVALRRLRLWPLLHGWRGGACADTGAAVSVVLTLQEMMSGDPGLAGIEINPLILRAEGAVVADAVIWEET